MFHCDVCNKEFTSKIGLHSHIVRSKDSDHHNTWLAHLRSLLEVDFIDILDFKRENNERLVKIRNHNCNHTIWINYTSLFKAHQYCNTPECVSKKKSEVIHKVMENSDFKSNVSKAVKEAFRDPIKKMNQLKGHAEVQRRLNSKYELMFMGLLTKYKIKYDYQVPLIKENVGMVIDFYLPDFNTYVNINSDIFHWLPKDKIKKGIRKSALAVQSKDRQVREIFARDNSCKFVELIEFEEMEKFILTIIKEVV